MEDAKEILVELAIDRKIGVDQQKEDMSASHCLPIKLKADGERALLSPAIIVRFMGRDVRGKLYRARKVLKDITSQVKGPFKRQR